MIPTFVGYRMATLFILSLFFIFEASCDNILGHNGKSDCENCAGKNGTYEHFSGLYTLRNPKYGYNYIITIPYSAMNITLRQFRSSKNHLALKKNSGNYILNGDWHINQPGQFFGCGTAFTYHREPAPNNETYEYIQAPGPLQEPVQLMLLVVSHNPGINYEFEALKSEENALNISVTDSTKDAALYSKTSIIHHRDPKRRNETIITNNQIQTEISVHKKRHRMNMKNKKFAWKSCFKSCDGVVNQACICILKSNERIVPDHRCSELDKPHEDNRCNNTKNSCLPEWFPLEWSACSVTCGEGVQTRSLICKQYSKNGEPITVSSEVCLTPPPPTTQKCMMKPCDKAVWEVGPWSQCSSTCGHGIRTRLVVCRAGFCPPEHAPKAKETCYTSCKQGGKWLISTFKGECSESCGDGWAMHDVICFGGECKENERPNNYVACSRTYGCGGQWFAGPWTKCSGLCGTGEQKRQVICVGIVHNHFEVVSDYKCKHDEKPATHQRCQLPKCSAMWYTSYWTECSQVCGGGVKYRDTICIGNSTESNLCPPEEKPPTSQHCNTNPCNNLIEGKGCDDTHPLCIEAVVQARLCVFDYYNNLCCQACYNRI